MKLYVSSWKASDGAKELAAALSVKRLKTEGSKFRGAPNKTVINWGASEVSDEVRKCRVLNLPDNVAKCTNKLTFFNSVAGKVSVPDFTTDYEVALRWVTEGKIVCARKTLNGSGAVGLVLMDQNNPETFVKAPLYTKYIPKKDEYRVHVLNKKVIDFQRKAKRDDLDPSEVNYKIRNLENGFVFVRGGVDLPDSVREESIKAVSSVGLDFGAVDVVFNDKQQKGFVLEVNTAPGLQGQTVISYATGFREMLNV